MPNGGNTADFVAGEARDRFGVGKFHFLAADVIRGERIYCEDEIRADEYELYVLRGTGDLAPLERERLSFVLKASRGTK